jgi:hypothetical protein
VYGDKQQASKSIKQQCRGRRGGSGPVAGSGILYSVCGQSFPLWPKALAAGLRAAAATANAKARSRRATGRARPAQEGRGRARCGGKRQPGRPEKKARHRVCIIAHAATVPVSIVHQIHSSDSLIAIGLELVDSAVKENSLPLGSKAELIASHRPCASVQEPECKRISGFVPRRWVTYAIGRTEHNRKIKLAASLRTSPGSIDQPARRVG